MAESGKMVSLTTKYIQKGEHAGSDYFGLIRELVKRRNMYDWKRPDFND